jgi:hypothetical protein
MPAPTETGYLALPWLDINGPQSDRSKNFELCVAEIAEQVFGFAPGAGVPYGRSGQGQKGLDLRARGLNGQMYGVQCKHREDTPATSKAMKTSFQRWFNEYWNSKTYESRVDYLIIAVTWPDDTAVQDLVSSLNAAHVGEVEVIPWTKTALNRLVSPYSQIIHRYFGANFARDAEAFFTSKLGAATQVGIFEYLGLDEEHAAELANAGHHIEAARLYKELADKLHEEGFAGAADRMRDEELRCLVRAECLEQAALKGAIRASRCLQDGQPSAAKLIVQIASTHAHKSTTMADVQLVEITLDCVSSLRIDPSLAERAVKLQTRDWELRQSQLIVLGEIALLTRQRDLLLGIAKQIDPSVGTGSELEGRRDALLIDANLIRWSRSQACGYAAPKAQVAAWMRHGRRRSSVYDVDAQVSDVQEAIDAYQNACAIALKAALVPAAASAYANVQWLRLRTGIANREEVTSDEDVRRSLYSASGTDRVLSIEALDQAGRLMIDESRSAQARTRARRYAGVASWLALASGEHKDERDALNAFSRIELESHNYESAMRSAVLAGNVDLAREAASFAPPAELPVQCITGGFLPSRIAAAAALSELGPFLSDEEGDNAIPAVLQLAVARTAGIGSQPHLYGFKALAAMMPVVGHKHWDAIVPVIEAHGASLGAYDHRSLERLLVWLARTANNQEARERLAQLYAALLASSNAEELTRAVLTACAELCTRDENASTSILSVLESSGISAHSRPEVLASLGTHYAASAHADLSASKLTILLSRRPEATETAKGYLPLPTILLRDVAKWTADEQLRVSEALLGIAEADLELNVTREDALEELATLLSNSIVEDLEIQKQRLCELARRLRTPGSVAIDADIDPYQHLWAEAIAAAICAVRSKDDLSDDMRGAIFELLFDNSEFAHVLLARALSACAHRGVIFLSPHQLSVHPSPPLRSAAVAVALAHNPVPADVVSRLASDSKASVRIAAARHVEALAAAGVRDIGVHLAADEHAVVRWFANDPLSQCTRHSSHLVSKG